jgi:hypothetical protein
MSPGQDLARWHRSLLPQLQRKTAPPGWIDGAADGRRLLRDYMPGPSGRFLRGRRKRVCVPVHRCERRRRPPEGKRQDPDASGKRARLASVIQLRWGSTTSLNRTIGPAPLPDPNSRWWHRCPSSAIHLEDGSASTSPANRSARSRLSPGSPERSAPSWRLRQSGRPATTLGKAAPLPSAR